METKLKQEPVADGGGLPPLLDAYLIALLKYSGAFYSTAIEHGMRAVYAAESIKHIESAARQLHKFGTEAQQALASSQEALRAAREENERQENIIKSGTFYPAYVSIKQENDALRERMQQAVELLMWFPKPRISEAISLLSPEGSSQRHCDYKNCSLPHGHIQSCNELDSKPEGSSR